MQSKLANTHKETEFGIIYRLAKEKNEKALTEVVASGACIGVFQGKYNPVGGEFVFLSCKREIL